MAACTAVAYAHGNLNQSNTEVARANDLLLGIYQ